MLELRVFFQNALRVEHSGGDSLEQPIAKLNRSLMKLHEAIDLLNKTGDQLTKASQEISAKIADLQNADPDLSEAGNAAVQRIAQIAQALDDVVPDAIPTDAGAPAPEITPIPQ